VVAHHKNTKFRHKDTAQPAHYSVGINVATRAKSVDQPRTSRTYYFCGASRADSVDVDLTLLACHWRGMAMLERGSASIAGPCVL
jgi:hypothetical protein